MFDVIIWCTRWTYHHKTVSNPQAFPSVGTVGNRRRLTVYGDHVGRSFTYDASVDERKTASKMYVPSRILFDYDSWFLPGNVFLNFDLFDWHHRQRSVCAEPIRLIVSTGVVAYVVEVTEQERHGGEFTNTRASESWKKKCIIIDVYFFFCIYSKSSFILVLVYLYIYIHEKSQKYLHSDGQKCKNMQSKILLI